VENAPASLSPHITISPGPTMASSVLSLADKPTRGAKSSAAIVPSAPRMSPTCASSRTAARVTAGVAARATDGVAARATAGVAARAAAGVAARAAAGVAVRVMVAMVNTPFTSQDRTETGAHAVQPLSRGARLIKVNADWCYRRVPGTEWDSSEEGQLRPGLSESIACLPSVATHGGARSHQPAGHSARRAFSRNT